jgi:hypothetical protein
LKLGDVYLDSYPTSDPEALAAAAHAGVPAVAWSGSTHRSQTASALLRGMGATELVATDEASYVGLAGGLAGDEALRLQVRSVLAQGPGCSDVLAIADGLTGLLERAHDEIVNAGNSRRPQTPIQLGWERSQIDALRESTTHAFAENLVGDAVAVTRLWLQGEPASIEARLLHSRALRLSGDPFRALTYAVAALAGNESQVEPWLCVAESLVATNQPLRALEACEAVLKLDAGNIDAWIMMSELAAAVGHHEFAIEAANAARSIDPADPRVAALAAVA